MGKKDKDTNDEPPPLNLNIGVMGHVDSGKTSLVKALSTTLSTASLDRAPQSQARGITLDLGFSSFRAPLPEHLDGDGDLQFTLVDCPGHASLIRTIIGGAQIIDAMVLVVDIIKGVQPQTAECLVIGEITTHDLIIALNKVDQISEEERPAAIETATKKLRRQLASSKFRDAPVVACAACVGGEKVAAVGRSELKSESIGLDELVATLRKRARVPKRDVEGPFFFAIDHCFPIRGQGTVVTGTALRGQCRVGDSVELPALGVEKKVKSMQMFRRPAKAIRCGDRAGLCLAQLDAAAIERGVVAAPGSVPGLTAVLALVRKVRFFRGRTDTERTFHVTLGHTTTVATAYFFGAAELNDTAVPTFDAEREYVYQEKLEDRLQWCLLKFEAKVRCQLDALVIGSHLESDAAMADACRIAFHGRLVERAEGDAIGEKIRLYKLKRKVGLVAKLGDPCVSTNGDMGVRDVVGKDLFARETNMAQFVGLRIQAETGEVGKLSSAFGKGGKFRVQFEGPTDVQPGGRLYLVYKKYAFSSSKALHQDEDCVVPADELVTPGKPPKKKVVEPPPPPPSSPKKTEDIREGLVERLKGDPLDSGRYRTVIVEGLFTAEEDQKQWVGAVVVFANGDEGVLAGPFGKAGKSKVDVEGAGTDAAVGASVTLRLPAR